MSAAGARWVSWWDTQPHRQAETAGDRQENGKGGEGSSHGRGPAALPHLEFSQSPDMTSQERAYPDFKGNNSFKDFNTYVGHVKTSYWGSGEERAPTANCLLYKCEEQSSIQEPMWKSQGWGYWLLIPTLRRQRQVGPWAYRKVTLSFLVSSRPGQDPVSKIR